MTPWPWTSGAELGDSPKEVEVSLAQLLRQQLLDYEFVQLDTYIKNENHKWRAVSALQKAIRRGNVLTALRMANGLHGLDWEYVWRRMAVIAIEEIGVADIVLVASVVWVSGKRSWREQNGGCLNYLYLLVERMARSVKDRSVCDLVCWADWAPDFADKRAEYFSGVLSFDWRRAALTDPDNYLADRMLAAWSIAGTAKCRGENVAEGHDGSFPALMQVWAAHGPVELPAAVRLICAMGAGKTGDAMPVAYPLVYEMAKRTDDHRTTGHGPGIGWRPDELVQLPPMGNYPSEAFDQYCREGKRAIRYFNKACAPVAEFLTHDCKLAEDDATGRYTVTSILVFRAEGAQVDRRLVFDGARDLFDLAELALNRSQGVPGVLNDYAMALVRDNLDSLHHARKVVLDMIPPGALSLPPPPVWLPKPDAWAQPIPNPPEPVDPPSQAALPGPRKKLVITKKA